MMFSWDFQTLPWFRKVAEKPRRGGNVRILATSKSRPVGLVNVCNQGNVGRLSSSWFRHRSV